MVGNKSNPVGIRFSSSLAAANLMSIGREVAIRTNMTENDGKQERSDAADNLPRSEIRQSSPEDPLIVPEAMSFPLGTHYFRVPDPRGATVLSFCYETGNPEIGRSVIVEMKVTRGEPPLNLRWAFRYLSATWSLICDFGKDEQWELVVEKVGPRTEMQVRALYELAEKLHFNATVEPLKQRWTKVKNQLLPRNWRNTQLPFAASTQKRMEELAEGAIVDLKLLTAKSSRAWHKRADPETTILQAFLQGRTSARLLCNFFDLDWKSCVPVLLGFRDAYDRLISEALGQRCLAVCKAHRKKKITLEQAAGILFLDTPAAEDILRIGSVVERKFKPADRPTKKQLLEAIDAIQAFKIACQPGTQTSRRR